jgi:hypothetical protein
MTFLTFDASRIDGIDTFLKAYTIVLTNLSQSPAPADVLVAHILQNRDLSRTYVAFDWNVACCRSRPFEEDLHATHYSRPC